MRMYIYYGLLGLNMADKDLSWEDLDKMSEQELWQLLDDIKIVLEYRKTNTPLDWVKP